MLLPFGGVRTLAKAGCVNFMRQGLMRPNLHPRLNLTLFKTHPLGRDLNLFFALDQAFQRKMLLRSPRLPLRALTMEEAPPLAEGAPPSLTPPAPLPVQPLHTCSSNNPSSGMPHLPLPKRVAEEGSLPT